MYKVTRHTRQFTLDNKKDAEDYDAILNNPLCVILREKQEKLTTKHFNDEGVPIAQEDKLIFVVTWEEKSLL